MFVGVFHRLISRFHRANLARVCGCTAVLTKLLGNVIIQTLESLLPQEKTGFCLIHFRNTGVGVCVECLLVMCEIDFKRPYNLKISIFKNVILNLYAVTFSVKHKE